MKFLFALQGASNNGKSTTLRMLIAEVAKLYSDGGLTILAPGKRDLKVLFKSLRGLKVGIETRGDPGSRLKVSLSDFQRIGCDIIFCSCRTRGSTTLWVRRLSPDYTVVFVQQKRVPSKAQKASNRGMMKSLMKIAGI